MKSAFLLLMFCLAEADDIRWEFNRLKSQLEGQNAALTLEMTQQKSDLTQLKSDLTQLKSDVKKLKYQCPSGWTKFGDSCYYMSTEEKTWQKSREYCQNKGADLVVINSGEEQDFVSHVGGSKIVWIGLTDRETEGVWKWVDGTPLTTPTYWGSGEPNDGGEDEDCAVFDNGGWNDIGCRNIPVFMCEIVF